MLLLLIGARPGLAQGLPWQWVRTQNSATGQVIVSSADVDAGGNVYVAGFYGGTLTLSGDAHPPRGNGDMYVAKYNAQGQLQWSRSGGGASSESYPSLAVDAAGNSYVVGAFFDVAATFNGVTLQGQRGKYTAYVLKFDAQGTQQWAVTAGIDATLLSVVLGPGGELYVGGRASQTIALSNGQTLGGFYPQDAYVLRLDTATGALLSGFRFGNQENDQVFGMAVDAAGDLYLGGYFGGTVAFGATSYTAYGFSDGFALKCSPTGQVRWVWRIGSAGADQVARLALNAAGQLVVAGGYAADRPTYYDQGTLPAQTTNCMDEAFTARLSAQGSTQWLRRAGSLNTNDGIAGLVLDAAGNSYVCSVTGASLSTEGTPAPITGSPTNGYLISYDAQGALRTVVQVGQTYLYTLIRNAAGELWLSGAYYPGASFSPVGVPTPVGAGGGFVARIGSLPLATRAAAPPLTLAPNPARDQVQVALPQTAASATTVTLRNALGQAVRAVPVAAGSRTATLDVRDLARGWYVVRWQHARGAGTQTLLLE
ncbi:hypothetical protein GCM10028821_37860 [Hymenobacter jeollabukensis]